MFDPLDGSNNLDVNLPVGSIFSVLALPETACREVYASTGYSASLGNLNGISLASDNVFSDGVFEITGLNAPVVTTGAAATVSVSAAQLTGTVDPRGSSTTAWIDTFLVMRYPPGR